MTKQISVLGSTGSIGKQALEVVASLQEETALFAICANRDVWALLEQARKYRPRLLGCETEFDTSLLPPGTAAVFGPGAAEKIAALPEADVVVNGVSGFAALAPLLAALRAGKRVALANKESVVCGKSLVDEAKRLYGGEVLPVDSEQSAIFQCLQNGRREEVDKLILTASGGPFWRMERDGLINVTVEQALSHPTWNMGKKITIDSATLFNKGLEIIEAAYLFDFSAEQIDVRIHPQSIVHSMVTYRDGACMANMSRPDMRLPIQYAITYPARLASVCSPLLLENEQPLTFYKPSLARFPALALAYQTLAHGGTYPLAYNGANEAAVEAFCGGRIGFLDIETVVDYTLNMHKSGGAASLAEIVEIDRTVRMQAENCILRLARGR